MRDLYREFMDSPEVTRWMKLRLWWEGEGWYHAENVTDLIEGLEYIEPKMAFDIINPYTYSAFIQIFRTGITQIDEEKSIYRIHDETGHIDAYWGPNNEHKPTLTQMIRGTANFFFSTRSFEDTGIEKDDWAYFIFMKYWPEYDLLNIMDVEKYRKRKEKKKTIMELLQEFMEELRAPEPLPGFG